MLRNRNLWNTALNVYSGGINSILSVVWVGIITRVLGVEEAGVFTIAYSTASLLLIVGHWGMRNFQVSDFSNKYNWNEYRISRVLTTVLMILIAAAFCLWMNGSGAYTAHKATVVFGVTALKALDAVEDVYHGKYQQDGKLYLAGFFMGTRLLAQMAVLSILLFLTRDLSLSVLVTVAAGAVILGVFLAAGNRKVTFEKLAARKTYVRRLLAESSPLFLTSFLSFFLNNMSKYVIDLKLNDTAEAYFGYISMPVFVMFLFSNFIYAPYIFSLSTKAADKKIAAFIKQSVILLGVILFMAVLVLVGGALFGIPALEMVYGVALSQYKAEFLVILLGSIFYACATYFLMLLTILRRQGLCMITTIITLIASAIFSVRLIETRQIAGAAYSYGISMFALFVIYLLLLVVFVAREAKDAQAGQGENGGAG